MTRRRVSVSRAMASARPALGICAATAVTGCVLSLTVAIPAAHADSLGDIRARVNGARSSSACPALNYSVELEGEAQARTGNTLPGVPPTGNYKGTFIAFVGNGDPAETAEVHAEVKADSAIHDCKYKDFGVGFFRTGGSDNVAIVLGEPAAPVAPPVPCPDGSTVPAGQTCPVVKPKAVTNAITASFDNSGATQFSATVNNSSPLPASCNYEAKGPITDTTRSFNVPPNGSHTETFDGVATIGHIAQYHITITCTDSSNTQTEPLGSVTKTVGW